jgi:hypothetical protein
LPPEGARLFGGFAANISRLDMRIAGETPLGGKRHDYLSEQRHVRNSLLSLVSSAGLALMLFLPVAARPSDLLTGINLGSSERLTVAQQNELLIDMKAAGVRLIRAEIGTDEKGLELAISARTLGIRIDWIVGFGGYLPGAPTRPYQPDKFPEMWEGHPLSYADPGQFRAYFGSMLARLEAAGITLAAFELGNEINWAAYNAEFPLPGQGRQFGLDDLYHEPEAKQIAVGYMQYLKLLRILKDVRDHSKLNRKTPIVTAGMANFEIPDGPLGRNEDVVSVDATFDFLRAHGLDALVDAYAVHVYPRADKPGDPTAAARRQERLADYGLAQCRPAKSAEGKPCWITEWGFAYGGDTKCPLNDTTHVLLVREMMSEFRKYHDAGRLVGAIYYTWNTDPWAKTIDPFSAYRCGGLTESGRLAIAPNP